MDTRVTFGHREGRVEAFDGTRVAGTLEFSLDGDRMVIEHTRVDRAFRGRGVGLALLREAVAAAEARKLKVVPVCSFAKVWLERRDGHGAAEQSV
jgi:predicted GNAT family acetyltransferase